jgi:transcriptional regulator with XRE-family HTH domain
VRSAKKTLGARVRELRIARGLSQEALGDRCGLSLNFVGRLERGEAFASPETLGTLTQVFKVPLSELFVEHDGQAERTELALFAHRAPGRLVRAALALTRALGEQLEEKPAQKRRR